MSVLRIRATNFRQLRDLSFDLQPGITLLIGPNGSGKSNVVDALLFVRDVFLKGGTDAALGTRGGLGRVLTGHIPTGLLELNFYGVVAEHGIVYASLSRREAAGVSAVNATNVQVSRPVQGPAPDPDSVHDWYAPENDVATTPYSLFQAMHHVAPFRNIADRGAVNLSILPAEDGSDLASVLHYHYSTNRELFDTFEQRVRYVLPEVDIIETPVTEAGMTSVSVRFHGDPERYTLAQLSSGTKDVLLLVAAVHFSAPGALVILEEPENHLHAGAQRALIQVLKSAVDRESKQFLLTTHSESLVQQVEPEAVFFCAREAAGDTRILPISELGLEAVWEGLGVDAARFVQLLSRRPQVLVVVEGRDDVFALEPLWEHLEIADRVLCVRSNGGGPAEIVTHAAALRDSLRRFSIPTRVFVVLDGDSAEQHAEKVELLAGAGFDMSSSHVWSRGEIESYLVLPTMLAKVASVPVAQA